MKLAGLARILGGRLTGNPDEEISGAAGLGDARPGDITFLLKPSMAPEAAASGASAILVSHEMPGLEKNQLIVDDPQLAFITLLGLFHPTAPPEAGISPMAFVSKGAAIGQGAAICPFVYLGEGASVGAGTILHPGVFIGVNSHVGESCILYPNVTVREGVRVGDRVIIHAGSVIGADGFGYAFRGGRHIKIPQVGGVIIEDDVEIGACAAIDRATTGNTVIGRGTKIDNLVQIAHNVKIGHDSVIVAQTGIAGSSTVGDHVIIAGQSGIADHASIEDETVLGAGSGVLPNSQVKKGAYAGTPILPHRQWLRVTAIVARLPEMHKTMAELEKRLSELERRLSDDEHQGD